MDKLQLMIEADRRGILPPEKKLLLDEALKRGLSGVPSKAAEETAAFEAQVRKDAAPTGLERFGRGFADITQGVKQGALMLKDAVTGGEDATAYTADKTEELKRYEAGRTATGDTGIDWARLGGNVAATAPAMLIPGAAAPTLTGRVAAGAGTGAVTGASFFTSEGDSKALQTLVGGVAGGAVPVAVEGVKRVAAPIVSKVASVFRQAPASGTLQGEITLKLQQQGIDWNKLTADARSRLLVDAEQAVKTGGSLDNAMLANKAIIESIPGAQATKASITRAPRDWQTEKNLRGIQGVGEGIVKREQQNATAMTEYLQALRGRTGGKAATAGEAGESAINAIRTQDKAAENAVTDLYNAYRASGLKDAKVPEDRLMGALTKIIDEVGLDNVPPAVQGRLKTLGFLGGERTKYLTVHEADAFNRLLNNNNPGHGPASKTIGMLKGALNESIALDTPGGGALLTKAREAAAQRFSDREASKGIAAAVEDVAPDKFVQKFITSADTKELRATLAELKKSPGGQQAVKDIKGTILDGLLLKATNSTSVDDVAFKAGNKNLQFSGTVFGKNLDAISPEKLHQIFTPDELGMLRTLQKGSKLLTQEVPFSDVNYSKTTSALANLLLKVGETPLLGKLVSPIIGTGKIGMNWIQNAADRKLVAEALIASAAKAGAVAKLPRIPGERFLPAGAAGVSVGAVQEGGQ